MKEIDKEVPAGCSTPKRVNMFCRLLRGLRLLVVSPHKFFSRVYDLLFRRGKEPEVCDRPKAKPIIIYTEVTAECNNRCVYCAIDRVKRTGVIKKKVRDSVVKLISAHPEINFRVYFHLVGEPLMYDGLEDYIKMLTLPNADLWVCTNGILLTDERVNKLHEAGLRNVWFSFFYTNEADYKKYVRSDFFPEAEKNLFHLVSKNDLFEKIHIVTFSKTADSYCHLFKNR
jgi:molybdenum cofactor biosynthesis enzyme MoaA